MDWLVVPIETVRLNPKKLRKLHPKKVAQYQRDYDRGDEFPPIEVENCGTFYTIRDGRHRYVAQHNLGYAMIDVVVVRGGGAVVISCEALARVRSAVLPLFIFLQYY